MRKAKVLPLRLLYALDEKHPDANDAKQRARIDGTPREASVLIPTRLQQLSWSNDGRVGAERTGMNQMELSSEELRSLPPRPPTLLAAPAKRRFVKLGRRTSDGSEQ